MKHFLAAAAIAAAGTMAAQAADNLKICVEGAYPPFSQTTPEGKVEGFDIDVANALCEQMGRECAMVQVEWDGIIPALLERKCDAIIASMSITPERQKVIDFTEKYYQTPAKFIAAKGADIEDTKEGLEGKVVGVQRGTIHQDFMEGEFPDVELNLYGTQDEAYLDLQSGRVDAVIADSIAMKEGFLDTEAGQDYEFFGKGYSIPKYHGEGAGIGIRKEDDELEKEFNQAIDAIRENGTYEEIQNKYFDFDIYGAGA